MHVIYPGSFDPFTRGHMDVVEQTTAIFGFLPHIVVMNNTDKKSTFDTSQKQEIIEASNSSLIVDCFSGSIGELIESTGKEQTIIIRGLRNTTDLEYEMQYQEFVRMYGAQLMYIIPRVENARISSSLVRNMLRHGNVIGDVSRFAKFSSMCASSEAAGLISRYYYGYEKK